MTRQSDPGMRSDGKLSPRESQYSGDGSLWRRRGASMGASVVTEPSPCERLLTRGGGRRRGLPRGRGAGLSGCDRWNSSVKVGSRISPEFTQERSSGPNTSRSTRYCSIPSRHLESSSSCTRYASSPSIWMGGAVCGSAPSSDAPLGPPEGFSRDTWNVGEMR